jgi:hypothetical protein
VRRSLKIHGKRKEKEKLPSGITADYSASFFTQLVIDRENDNRKLDRGSEEILSSNTMTVIDLNNGDVYERHHIMATSLYSSAVSATYVPHSDSSDNIVGGPTPGVPKVRFYKP